MLLILSNKQLPYHTIPRLCRDNHIKTYGCRYHMTTQIITLSPLYLEVMMLYLGVQEVGMSFVDVVCSMEVITTPGVQLLEHGMERCMEDKMSINCTTM